MLKDCGNTIESGFNKSLKGDLPAIKNKFPSSDELANTRNNTTLRYAGMNSNEPMRNIARWEKRPRGGLNGDERQSISI